jgi:hypothetical protein
MRLKVAFCDFVNAAKNDIPSEIRGYVTEHGQPGGIKLKTTQHKFRSRANWQGVLKQKKGVKQGLGAAEHGTKMTRFVTLEAPNIKL